MSKVLSTRTRESVLFEKIDNVGCEGVGYHQKQDCTSLQLTIHTFGLFGLLMHFRGARFSLLRPGLQGSSYIPDLRRTLVDAFECACIRGQET